MSVHDNNIHEQIRHVRHRFDGHVVKLVNVTSTPSNRLGALHNLCGWDTGEGMFRGATPGVAG